MKAWICVPVIVLALAGCAGKTAYRDSCGSQLDAAWKELDLEGRRFCWHCQLLQGFVAVDWRQDSAAV